MRRLERAFGTPSSQEADNGKIDFMKLSVEMGLHKHSMDFIKVKSKNYIEQITRFKDSASSRNDSKSIMGGEMNKSAMTMINAGNSHV